MKYLDLFVSVAALAFLAGGADAQPIVIHGNSQGLWSPNGSVANLPALPPQSKAPERSHVHTPPPPPVVKEVAETTDVCPTYQSAPHLCES
jgi:hypothetical protein